MARILVIDDDSAVCATLEIILEQGGHEVACVSDGAEGLHAVATAVPDLIVTDIIMPNQEGLELILQVRGLHPRLPIIAISGGGRMGYVDCLELALDAGADEILSKPFERPELDAAIRRLLPV